MMAFRPQNGVQWWRCRKKTGEDLLPSSCTKSLNHAQQQRTLKLMHLSRHAHKGAYGKNFWKGGFQREASLIPTLISNETKKKVNGMMQKQAEKVGSKAYWNTNSPFYLFAFILAPLPVALPSFRPSRSPTPAAGFPANFATASLPR